MTTQGGQFKNTVKCGKLNSIGSRGNVKEGLKLTPMNSFDVEQGGVNSGPGSRGVTEQVRTDGPSFSLCAVPLESSGPGFCGVGQRLGEQAEVRRCTRPEMSERVKSERRSQGCNINWTR